MPFPFRGEIEAGLTRNHHAHLIMDRRDGELVGRIRGRLRGGQSPDANAEICASNLEPCNQCEQREITNSPLKPLKGKIGQI